jgi:hypothetical protein
VLIPHQSSHTNFDCLIRCCFLLSSDSLTCGIKTLIKIVDGAGLVAEPKKL